MNIVISRPDRVDRLIKTIADLFAPRPGDRAPILAKRGYDCKNCLRFILAPFLDRAPIKDLQTRIISGISAETRLL